MRQLCERSGSTGVTTDGSAITIKFNPADVAVVDTNQFSDYAPFFAGFADYLDRSKVQIKNIAVENSVEITLEGRIES